MLNQVLWVLDNEVDPRSFERLCTDLLYRNGYEEIVPVGGIHDRGRDAELITATGVGETGEIVFFQFSLQKAWREKLYAELKKVAEYGHHISSYVFVTSQGVSGKERDKLKAEVAKSYGWRLVVLDREWLRLQLEEGHRDLAQKYLGIQLPELTDTFASTFEFTKPSGDSANAAWVYFTHGDFERAAVELREYLLDNPDTGNAWEPLAWSQYNLFQYKEALASINKSLELDPTNEQASRIRACILAEFGISHNDRASVLEANEIFRASAASCDHWTACYNYGNTLSALGKHEEAITQYLKALKCDPKQIQVWKNLGSAYHRLGAHDREMRCFNEALEIDPAHSITLMCKGVSLLIDFDQAEDGACLIERALAVDEKLAIQWPHAWYWLAEAYRKVGDLDQALTWVNKGLRHRPGHLGLREMKAAILSDLWKNDRRRINEATEFFKFLIDLSPLDYSSRQQLAELYHAQGRSDEAWGVLQETFSILDMQADTLLRLSGFSVEQCSRALRFLPFYKAFRDRSPVAAYWDVSDPMFGIDQAPARNPEFEDAMFVLAAIPFGLGYAELEAVPVEARDGDLLASFFNTIRSGLQTCIPKAACKLVTDTPEGADVHTIAQRLSELLVFLPLVALREFSRQRGWICSMFEVSHEELMAVMDDYDELEIETKTRTACLIEINTVLQRGDDK